MAELRPHYIDVDLKKNTQYNVPVVTQNDTATHFIIRVTDDGLSDPELLDAYQEITMTSQRPDGESFYLTGTRIPGTNEIEFHLGTDETAFSGSVLASLQFYLVEDASRYTSAQFRYDVKKDLTKNYTPTQREETLVEVVLRDGPDAIREAREAKQAVDGALVDLEQDKTAAIERLDEVTEENKTIFRQPVNTFADLATSYPNPEHGTTVRVTGESAMYRYSDGSWVKTDEYNPTAIDQVTAQLAEKASKAEVNQAVGQIAEGTPLFASNIAGMTDTSRLYANTTDGLIYRHNGTAFISTGVQYQSSGIADYSITEKKLNFTPIRGVKRANLFKEEEVEKGYFIFLNDGAPVPSSLWSISGFIAVAPNTQYTLAYDGNVGFYDSEKQYISGRQRVNPGDLYNPITITTPPNTSYIRTSILIDKLDDYRIEAGNSDLFNKAYVTEDDLLPSIVTKLNKENNGGSDGGTGYTGTTKILMIGNSFSVDANEYLYSIADSAGVNIITATLWQANGSLSQHWDNIQNSTPYTYEKWVSNERVTTNVTLNVAVMDEEWDFIIFQQVSSQSGLYDSFQPYLNSIVSYTKGITTNPNVKMGLHMTWAYSTDFASGNFVYYDNDQMKMYNSIINAYRSAMVETAIDVLIPSGTSIQNARSDEYLTSIGRELTRDGSHLDYVMGRFIASLTIFEALLSGRYKKDIFHDVTFKPNTVTNDSLIYFAKLSVNNSLINPFKITENK